MRYDSPAARWRESLPLGNGHLGITVFGGVCHERLQLSENSIYSGGWGTLTVDPLEAEYIKRQRELAVGGDLDAAVALTFEEFKQNWKGERPEPVELEGFKRVSKPARRPIEQTLGNLDLFFPSHDEVVEDYERRLDLNRAVVTTSYRVGDTVFEREVFCSYPDDVMVMKLSSSDKARMNASPSPEAEHSRRRTTRLSRGKTINACTRFWRTVIRSLARFRQIRSSPPARQSRTWMRLRGRHPRRSGMPWSMVPSIPRTPCGTGPTETL
ncbi:MAG: glycoside hydrolase family 95 protein [Kiritimatiellae bacterium]|nr:glycoside hydrolase family 95 protein [Kiritimatiellia bacterium]